MAGVKISQLPGVASALLTDFFPVVQAGTTSQETLAQVSTLFQTIMLPLSGGTMTGAVNMGGFQINDVGSPTSGSDAATKSYVDTIATGGGAPVYAATTANLNVTQAGAGVGATLTNAGSQAAFSVDGQTPPLGSRILVKNQSTNTQNGVYTLTTVGSGSANWVLTRATDYDTPTDINATGIIPVTNGTVNANSGWVNTTLMITVDTTAITFIQFGVPLPISLADGGTGQALTTVDNALFSTTSGGAAQLSATAPAGLTFPQPIIQGFTNASSASAGDAGETISSTVAGGSAVSLTSTSTANITSISLTAGNWDVWGWVTNVCAGGTLQSGLEGGISTANNTIPTPSPTGSYNQFNLATGITVNVGLALPVMNVTISSTASYYLNVNSTFSVSTNAAYGWITARRRIQ